MAAAAFEIKTGLMDGTVDASLEKAVLVVWTLRRSGEKPVRVLGSEPMSDPAVIGDPGPT